MYFALRYEVVDGFVEKRVPFREEHLGQVREAHERGDLFMAGAVGDPPAGALLIFRGDSVAAAEGFARRDPYVLQGLVVRWQAAPWNVVVGP